MVLKLYTFRAKHSGKIKYATGHNAWEAGIKTGLPPRDLDLLKIETIPVQERFVDHGFQAHKPLADRRRAPS